MHAKTSNILRTNRRAFTLVELLVVIGIIALLISVLLPALSRARRQAQVVQCAASLHNIGASFFAYAADNKGFLPQLFSSQANAAYHRANPNGTAWPDGGGNWPWDMPVTTRNTMIQYGCARNGFYCPSNYEAMNTNGLWNFNVTATVNGVAVFSGNSGGGTYVDASGKSFDTYPFPDEKGFGVMGYAFLLQRIDGSYPDSEALPNNTQPRKWNYQATLRPRNTPCAATNFVRPPISSDIEIAFDAMISNVSSAGQPYTFGNVIGGYPTSHQSSHWYGGLPTGGNELYMDGHVSWKPFDNLKPVNVFGGANSKAKVQPRCQLAGAPGTGLIFWW